MGPEELNRQLDQADKAGLAVLAAGRQKRAEAEAAGLTERALTEDEEQFVKDFLPRLPAVIPRAKVPHYLGGLVSSGALANADSKGRGPKKAYKVGCRMVAYETESLLQWIALHFNVSRISRL